MRIRTPWAAILALTLLAAVFATTLCGAADITSSYANYRYTYTITPHPGEDVRSFHIYSGARNCGDYSFWDLSLPAGWLFHWGLADGDCVLIFYTTGDPLPTGQTTTISYTHYGYPCCQSWFLSDEGNTNALAHVVDDDEQHTEACNIPAPWSDQCGGPGLIVAPKYPEAVDNQVEAWGLIKATYR